jgi:hypothetical protein
MPTIRFTKDGRARTASRTGPNVVDQLPPSHAPLAAPPSTIPSAVDPHTVERACPRVTRWSALPDERPWHPGAGLIGSAWAVGGWDGAPPSQMPEAPPPETLSGRGAAVETAPARRPMPAGGRQQAERVRPRRACAAP